MARAQEILIHFKDMSAEEKIRSFIEERCQRLGEVFPETMRFEISLQSDGDGFTAHAHVTGRKTDVAVSHDWARELGQATDKVLDKLEARLRKHHDKVRMSSRRKAAKMDSEDSSEDL
jgi:ribosomal subunit interface protein